MRYGDQNEVLNFRDLIEVQSQRDGTVDVRFRNLEYDLTRAIKKAVYGFQSVDNLLASLPGPVKLTLFATPNTLPEALKDAPQTVGKVAQELPASRTASSPSRSSTPTRPAPRSPASRCSTPTSCAPSPSRSSPTRATIWTWC